MAGHTTCITTVLAASDHTLSTRAERAGCRVGIAVANPRGRAVYLEVADMGDNRIGLSRDDRMTPRQYTTVVAA